MDYYFYERMTFDEAEQFLEKLTPEIIVLGKMLNTDIASTLVKRGVGLLKDQPQFRSSDVWSLMKRNPKLSIEEAFESVRGEYDGKMEEYDDIQDKFVLALTHPNTVQYLLAPWYGSDILAGSKDFKNGLFFAEAIQEVFGDFKSSGVESSRAISIMSIFPYEEVERNDILDPLTGIQKFYDEAQRKPWNRDVWNFVENELPARAEEFAGRYFEEGRN